MKTIVCPNLDHVKRLFGAHGIVQFAKGTIPDMDSGFCLDDNVRLLMLAVTIRRADPLHRFAIEAGNTVFDFIDAAAAQAPVYHNMMDEHGDFTDRFASPESIGRLIWSLGITLRDSRDRRWISRARFHMERAMTAVAALSSEHSRAFAALGWAAAVEAGYQQYRDALHAVAEAMHFEFERNASEGWDWTLARMDYDNGRLPEALMRAGDVLDEEAIVRSGRRMMRFLAEVTQPNDMFVPIGAPGWYHTGSERPYYSQQPLEALAMVDAWLAYGDEDRARVAYQWFLGRNTDGFVMGDVATGGCHDGIHARGELNVNMGAESTLAFVQAGYTLGLRQQGVRDRLAPAIVGELGATRGDRDEEIALGA